MSKNRKCCFSWIGLIMRTPHTFIFCVLAVTTATKVSKQLSATLPFFALRPLHAANARRR